MGGNDTFWFLLARGGTNRDLSGAGASSDWLENTERTETDPEVVVVVLLLARAGSGVGEVSGSGDTDTRDSFR